MSTKQRTRKTLKVNQAELLKHLKVISTHGLFEQGNEKALEVGRNIFYWQKGNERSMLSLSEVSQQLNKI